MEIIGGARPVARDGLRLHSDSPFLHTYYIEVRVTFLKEFQVFGKIKLTGRTVNVVVFLRMLPRQHA